MAEILSNIFSFIFGGHSILATIVVAMFPIIELKGAIPLGMSVEFWGENALTSTQAFICSLLGSCVVIPIIALFFAPIIRWMKNTRLFRNIADKIDGKVRKSSDKIGQRIKCGQPSNKVMILKMLGVFAFVAIPLPLTGVWTGTCIGVAIGLKFWQTVVSVILGNIVAGMLIMFVCSAFPQFTDIIFFVVLGIVFILLIVAMTKTLLAKSRRGEDM